MIPDDRKEPETFHYEVWLETFFMLSNFRTSGFDIGTIQLIDILNFHKTFFRGVVSCHFFIKLMSALDKEFLKYNSSKK